MLSMVLKWQLLFKKKGVSEACTVSLRTLRPALGDLRVLIRATPNLCRICRCLIWFNRRTSQSHAIHIHSDVVMERAHAAMAMGLTPTPAHTYTNMHTRTDTRAAHNKRQSGC